MTESHKTIYEALLSIQQEIEQKGEPQKDSTNPHFKSKYVDLASLRAYLRPLLNKHGVVILHSAHDGNLLTTALLTTNNKDVDCETEVSVPLFCEKQTPQGMGSALTYACRYSLCLLFGISGEEDDDGNEASKPVEHKQATLPVRHPPSPPEAYAFDEAKSEIGQCKTLAQLSNVSLKIAGAKKANRFSEADAEELKVIWAQKRAEFPR